MTEDEAKAKPVPTDTGIGFAVKQLWSGERVRRAGWRDKGMWLVMVRGCKRRTGDGDAPVSQAEFWGLGPHVLEATQGRLDEAPVRPFVVLYSGVGELTPWTCSQADLLAVDWEAIADGHSTGLADADAGDRCARCGAPYLPAGNCSRWEEGCQGGRGDGWTGSESASTGDVNAALEKASRQAEETVLVSWTWRGPDGEVLF